MHVMQCNVCVVHVVLCIAEHGVQKRYVVLKLMCLGRFDNGVYICMCASACCNYTGGRSMCYCYLYLSCVGTKNIKKYCCHQKQCECMTFQPTFTSYSVIHRFLDPLLSDTGY